MIFGKVIMKRLTQAYELIYKKTPNITEGTSGYFTVEGIGTAHVNTWKQVAMYYRWCALNRHNPRKYTDEIFEKLEEWYAAKKVNTLALSIIFNVSRKLYTNCYRNTRQIRAAYQACLKGGFDVINLTWNGVTMSDKEWAKHLDLNHMTFRRRIRHHGKSSPLTFMTKDEYRLVSNTEKRRSRLNVRPEDVIDSEYGNEEWKKLSNSKKANVEDIELTYKQAAAIFEAMISDAKVNMVKRHKTYFGASKSFLMNGNGTLKYLLETVAETDLNRALTELEEFATEKYQKSTIVKGTVITLQS